MKPVGLFPFIFSILLILVSIMVDPEKYALLWSSYYTSYLSTFLFLFGSLFILIRHIRYLMTYFELPPSLKKRYQIRFSLWLMVYLGGLLFVFYLYPLFTTLVAFFLILREIWIWNKKKKRALSFTLKYNEKKQRKIDANC